MNTLRNRWPARMPVGTMPMSALCLALLAGQAFADASSAPVSGIGVSTPLQVGAQQGGAVAVVGSPPAAVRAAVGSPKTFAVQGLAAGSVPQVYIGTVHGWSDLNAHPDQWSYVRANADGFYANFIQLLPTVGDPGLLCRQTAPLMAHKNAYFESDSRYTGLGGFPNGGQFTLDTEAQEINELLNAGFAVPYSSLNYGVDNAKLSQCRTLGLPAGTTRPCLAQNGPWLFGGDITLNVQDNATIRKDIARTEGESTDGPFQLWVSNQGQMQQGSVSVTKYARGLGKLTMVMLSPGDLPAAQWLATAQQCVRYHEDQGAIPDIWADYAYDTQTPTLPEKNADGTPANTVTGAAYWLIHHLSDPAHSARLSVTGTSGLRPRTAGADTGTMPVESTEANLLVPITRLAKGRFQATQTVNLTLRNESAWLDLSPVLYATLDDPGHNWAVGFRLGGVDITQAVVQQGGFVFVKDQRLWPQAAKAITMTLSCRNPSAQPLPATVKVGLMASPGSADKVTQTMTFHASVPRRSKK